MDYGGRGTGGLHMIAFMDFLPAWISFFFFNMELFKKNVHLHLHACTCNRYVGSLRDAGIFNVYY